MEYASPSIEDYGDLEDLTHGQTSGNFTDANFPVNTPFQDLTFSS